MIAASSFEAFPELVDSIFVGHVPMICNAAGAGQESSASGLEVFAQDGDLGFEFFPEGEVGEFFVGVVIDVWRAAV